MPEKSPKTTRKLFSAYTVNILFIMFALVGLALVSDNGLIFTYKYQACA